MRHQLGASALMLFALILSALGQTLLPVSVRRYEAALGLQRRDFDHLQDFHPQAHTELVYGLDQGADKTLVANITLQQNPGLPIVLLERFEHLTADADCRGRSGHISLTFTSENTFRQALKAWRYINDHVDHQFLLIANHDGCAPEDDRQPYIIDQIVEDPITLTTHLKSRPVQWKHISENLEMTVAAIERRPASILQHPLGSPNQKSKLRGRDVAELTNRGDPFKFNWATEKDKKVKFIQSISNNIQGFCTNCLARGSFLFTFSVSKKGVLLDASNLSISGSNIEAAITLSLLRRGQNQLEGNERFSEDIDVLGSAVPGLGLNIGRWAKAGLTWAYQVGYSGSISGNFEISTTVRTKNPGSSLLTLDFIRFDSRESNVDNWEFFKPEFNIIKLEGGGSFEFHGQLAGVFGFELIDRLTIEAKVSIPIPVLKFELTPQKSQGGLCKAAGIDTGVVAQVKFGTQLTVSGEYKFGGSSVKKQAGLDPIIDATFPIGNPVCVAIKVPIAGQQGKKPLPGQKPPGAKKPAAKTKNLSSDADVDDSSDDELASDLTPVDFAGSFSPVTSNGGLVSSGASLDDGSTPGSVTVAFDDPQLIAMQGTAGGNIANSNSGSTATASSPTGGQIASATTDGTTGNLASNDGSSANEPSYQFFLDDGSNNNPTGNLASNGESSADPPLYQYFLGDGSGANPGGSTSGNVVASNAGTSNDLPLYDAFLDDASTAGAGVFSSSSGNDVSLSSSSPVDSDVSLFRADSADVAAGHSVDNQVAEFTSFPGLSSGDISSSSLGTAAGTSNSEPNLFMEGSDMTLAGLPAGDETYSFNNGADLGLFADSLSTGADLFSRKVRRQEPRNPSRKGRRRETQNLYSSPEERTPTRLRRRTRRREQDMDES